MNIYIILLLLLFLSIYYIFNYDIEHYSNEAIGNLSSLYNQNKMTVGDLRVTGTLTVGDSAGLIPKGGIIAWTGTKPPKGWIMCDGNGGSPNLRGKFILAYGGGQGSSIGKTGGQESVSLTTDQIPKHDHDMPFEKGSGSKTTVIDTYSDGQIKKQSTSDEGGGQSHENMPPYYVLAYIMKL